MSRLEGYAEMVEALASFAWAEAINKQFGMVDNCRRHGGGGSPEPYHR